LRSEPGFPSTKPIKSNIAADIPNETIEWPVALGHADANRELGFESWMRDAYRRICEWKTLAVAGEKSEKSRRWTLRERHAESIDRL
jgi:hypothetical protein